MRDLQDLAAWFAGRGPAHQAGTPTTLPSPSFIDKGRRCISFSSNNYLALATSERLKARAHAALETYGVGNCESRLLGGNLSLYEELEARLASVKGKDAAILFATGFLTNLGVLPALVRLAQTARLIGYRPQTAWTHAFFTDQFNHLSIREGIRASGAPSITFKHLDMNDLEAKLKTSVASVKIIVTDGVFSQHGDIVPLPDMMTLADRYDASVYIDDAHGTGVLGATGSGTTEHFNIGSPRIISMGTLSKAYGCIGGFVATDATVATLLRAGCAAYGFTSTLPPDQAAAVLEALDMVVDEPSRRERLWANQRHAVARMARRGLQFTSTQTPILPFHVGDETACAFLANSFAAEGLHVDAITFPAIPMGQSRLRFIMNAEHDTADIDRAVDLLGHLANHVAPALPAR
ncbi:MAG: pyridoxal phosphate-dependent aminotransferase family protein [Acidobacteriota bacterium]